MMDVSLVVEGCVLVAGIQKDDGMNMVGTVEGTKQRGKMWKKGKEFPGEGGNTEKYNIAQDKP